MTTRLNPYLLFPGTAREALTFYHGIFGGELTIMTFGDLGAGDQMPADNVMHGRLDTEAGYTLMASDGSEGTIGDRIMVSISGDEDRLREYWAGLSEGAEVTRPLEAMSWGDELGQLTDRFGVRWMVDIGAPGTAG